MILPKVILMLTTLFTPNLSVGPVEEAVEAISPQVQLPRIVYREVMPGAKERAYEKFVANMSTGVANTKEFSKQFALSWDAWRNTNLAFDPSRALPVALRMDGVEAIDPRETLKVTSGVAASVVAASAEIKLPKLSR
jgi:hypothetical protein